MAVDPAWAGVVGTAVGGLAASATSLLGPLIGWNIERKKLDKQHDHDVEMAAKQAELEKQRAEAEAVALDRDLKRQLVRSWREGLAEFKARDSAAEQQEELAGASSVVYPSNGGETWFETLRPHLVPVDPQSERIRDSYNANYSPSFALFVSMEIGRIERTWGLL